VEDAELNGTLHAIDVRTFAIAFGTTMLAIGGLMHLFRPSHLAAAAAQHRAARVLPSWILWFERPGAVGMVECGLAAFLVVASVVGGHAFEFVGIAVGVWSLVLLAVLFRLRSLGEPVTCGCQPLAGEVTAASFAPASCLLGSATAAVATTVLADVSRSEPLPALVLSALAAVSACTVLVYAAATSSTMRRTSEI
jgi:hypothetical protein